MFTRSMSLRFQEYQAQGILNVHKHVDGPWFWTKYSAHPYVGCRSGCEFCYSRGRRYLGKRDPATFDSVIRVKTNAAELLRTELSHREPDVINAGDWQVPAESRYELSRKMLVAVLEQGFPLLVIARSPLVARDLDLLVEIDRRTWVGVIFSISSLDPNLKRAFEPRSPGVRARLAAMAAIAEAGILVGTALMPILPFVGDDQQHLADVVRATKDHGGRFVLGGGLTMDGVQARRTLGAYRQLDPALEPRLRQHYAWAPDGEPDYGPPTSYSARIGRRVRELCGRHGLGYRMPRYIIPGPLAVNRRLAERLFLRMHDLELEEARDYRIWAYRKAAWTVDEWPESVSAVYQVKGEPGLRELPNVGRSIGAQIAGWLEEETL